MNELVLQRFESYRATSVELEKSALKEIVQEIALLGLWRSKFFEHAAFYGGTSLRILYGLNRFSEDLDFTLLRVNPKFSLADYCSAVGTELSAYGFDVKVETKDKKNTTVIDSAFIKADTVTHLLKVGSKHKAAKGELLQIKFEVDTNPALGFQTQAKPFFWPHPFSVVTCDLPSLFAGKLHATFCRERTRNVKGRDFYDFLWFVGRKVRPNYAYLENKLRQTGHWPESKPFSEAAFQIWAKERLQTVDVKAAKEDIVWFIKDSRELDGWSQEVFEAALEQITF